MLESVSLGILGHSIPTGTHVCAFYSGPDGRDKAPTGEERTGKNDLR